MKKYEDLTEEEKEKLLFFMLMKNHFSMQNTIVMIVSIFMVIVGITLVLTMYLPLFFGGVLFSICGSIFILNAFKQKDEQQKKYHLIFDNETIFSDFFNIKPSDLEGMKLRWVKEK